MELMLMGRYRLLIIKIFGELDQHKASSVRENADRELGRTGAVNVAFNFENVTLWTRRVSALLWDDTRRLRHSAERLSYTVRLMR